MGSKTCIPRDTLTPRAPANNSIAITRPLGRAWAAGWSGLTGNYPKVWKSFLHEAVANSYDGPMRNDKTQPMSEEEQALAQRWSLEPSRPPAQVPGYVLHRLLGTGAYGQVWMGTDENTGRSVAIKFYAHRGGMDWSLLSREVEKLAFLSSDRFVVQVLDVGWNGDPPYCVMEYVEQGSLSDWLESGAEISIAEAERLIRQIAIGLMHAHAKGILHCDLKPANVLLDQDRQPRLADFGQARLSYEQTPSLGTLFYMAPEQAHLEAVPDVSLGRVCLGRNLVPHADGPSALLHERGRGNARAYHRLGRPAGEVPGTAPCLAPAAFAESDSGNRPRVGDDFASLPVAQSASPLCQRAGRALRSGRTGQPAGQAAFGVAGAARSVVGAGARRDLCGGLDGYDHGGFPRRNRPAGLGRQPLCGPARGGAGGRRSGPQV